MGDLTDEQVSEPAYYYVRDKRARVAHHWDYLNDRNYAALCGYEWLDPEWEGAEPRPPRVCAKCEKWLPEYHALWWRKRAEELEKNLASLSLEMTELKRENRRIKKRRPGVETRSAIRQRSQTRPTPVDNSKEAIARRNAAIEGPLAAANIPAKVFTQFVDPKMVFGGLPGTRRRH